MTFTWGLQDRFYLHVEQIFYVVRQILYDYATIKRLSGGPARRA